jgi:hypothetical protein
LIEHLESHKELYGTYPETATADSGYGSEENYQFIEEKQIEGFIVSFNLKVYQSFNPKVYHFT